jgi:hypothetical protein
VIKNILILKDNVLYLKKNRDLLKISVNFLNELSDDYFIITKSFIDLKNQNLSFNEESFMNVDCIVTIKPSSDSIKKIDGNILVDHLDRNEFKKITYPIYIQKNSLSIVNELQYTHNNYENKTNKLADIYRFS